MSTSTTRPGRDGSAVGGEGIRELLARRVRYQTRPELVRSAQVTEETRLGAVIATVRGWHAAGWVTSDVRFRAYDTENDPLFPIGLVMLPGRRTRSIHLGDWFFVRTDGRLRISEQGSRPFPERVIALQHTGPLAAADMLDLVREWRNRLDIHIDLRPSAGPGGEPMMMLLGRGPHLAAMTGLDIPVGVREHGPLHLGDWLLLRADPGDDHQARLHILSDEQFRTEFMPLGDTVINPVDRPCRAGR